jgi:uncharacterized membrane protein YphA (DoxX/SURF4 family)
MKISPAFGLALARIGFGLYFLSQAWDKTAKGWFTNADPLRNFLKGSLPNAIGFYKPFVESVVLPNAGLFAILATLGEWVVGLSLVLGLFTRVGALIALKINLNFMLIKGLASAGGSIDRLFFLACLAFLLASAGLELGLDGVLSRALGRIPVIGWLAGGNPHPKREPRIYSIPARA